MALIELQGITKYYEMGSQVVKALDGIDIEVSRNDYLAFIGSSGSGKSTMLNILGCLDRPTSGEYNLNGKNVEILDQNELSEIRNLEIGFIFQSFNLLPRANALGNVMQPLIYRNIGVRKRKEMAMEALTRVRLDDRVDHLPNQLSGGQRQRLNISRTLILDAKILIFDDSTSSIDVATEQKIRERLKEVASERITLIISHRLASLMQADQIVYLENGRIVERGNHDDLMHLDGHYARLYRLQTSF